MSKTKFLAATCLSTSLLLSAGFTNVAKAEEINQESQENSQLTQEQIDYMTSFFNKYNVDNETQQKLINKIKDGIMMDCNLLDKEPIDTYTIESDNLTEVVDVYEDGSINVISIDLSNATVEEAPEVAANKGRAIDMSYGSTQSGSGYTNFKNAYITAKSAIVRAAGFYANFTLVQGVGSYIEYVDPAYNLSLVTGYSNNEGLAITNTKETSTKPAEAILKFTYVAWTGAGSTTCWIKLRLQNGKATTTSQL